MKQSLGIIKKVFVEKIVIEIFNLNKLNQNYDGDVYLFDGINCYIEIEKDVNNKIIYQINGMYEEEKAMIEGENSKFKKNAYLEAIPVGTLENSNFEFGISDYPMIGDDIYFVSNQEFESILSGEILLNEKVIELGELSNRKGFYPKVKIDDFFTTHVSVLGNTGSGKSTSIKRLFLEIEKKITNNYYTGKNLNFYIFDLHDEYRELLDSKNYECFAVEDISVPLEKLDLQDWLNLIIPSTGAQLPVVVNALKLGSVLEKKSDDMDWIKVFCALTLYQKQQTDAVTKRAKILGLLEGIEKFKEILGTYSAQYGNFSSSENEGKFIKALENYIENSIGANLDPKEYLYDILESSSGSITRIDLLEKAVDIILCIEESFGNSQVRSYCSTLMTRIQSLKIKYNSTLFSSEKSRLDKFNSFLLHEQKSFHILDCSSLDDEDLSFFTSFILRQIFVIQRKNRADGTKKMTHFIFDEAHKYITEQNNSFFNSIEIFEKIAKEGRKFGIFMIIASQRVSELSKTVLSQCNNFILHRIRNNIDLDQIRKSIPFITETQIYRLSYLKTGVALAIGEAFKIPLEIKIKGGNADNRSSTLKPSEIWNETNKK